MKPRRSVAFAIVGALVATPAVGNVTAPSNTLPPALTPKDAPLGASLEKTMGKRYTKADLDECFHDVIDTEDVGPFPNVPAEPFPGSSPSSKEFIRAFSIDADPEPEGKYIATLLRAGYILGRNGELDTVTISDVITVKTGGTSADGFPPSHTISLTVTFFQDFETKALVYPIVHGNKAASPEQVQALENYTRKIGTSVINRLGSCVGSLKPL